MCAAVGQHAGIHTEGSLQVLMDIGLEEAVGMSAQGLRDAIASWEALKKQVDDELKKLKKQNVQVDKELTKLKNHTDLIDDAGETLAEKELRDKIKSVKDLKNQVVGLNLKLTTVEDNQRDQTNEFQRKLDEQQNKFEENQLHQQYQTNEFQRRLDEQQSEFEGKIMDAGEKLERYVGKADQQLQEQKDEFLVHREEMRKYIMEKEDTDEKQPDTQEEPGIALEDQLRITEQSAKAIDILTNHLLSTVWQTCSKNTFGKCGLTVWL
jgi:hypothetical protein